MSWCVVYHSQRGQLSGVSRSKCCGDDRARWCQALTTEAYSRPSCVKSVEQRTYALVVSDKSADNLDCDLENVRVLRPGRL